MNSKKSSIEVDGKTVQEAIRKGLSILGVERRQVSIRILSEETQGLFGMRGAKPAKIQMSVKGASET